MYTYFCRERPPVPGAVPKKGLIEVYEYPHPIYDQMDGHLLYGYVNYDRKLTAEEVSAYELLPQEG